MDDDHSHARSTADAGWSGRRQADPGVAPLPDEERDHHPCDEYEALPDDAVRPRVVTIRPRYADDSTAVWVSAAIEDVVSLPDSI